MQTLSESSSSLIPELRRQIAIACDPGAVARLCLVDRAWHADSVPVLYERVGLVLGMDETQLARSAAFLRTLEESAGKAALVRTLRVHYSLGHHWGSGEGIEGGALGLTKRLFNRELFVRLANLSDLRIRNGNFAETVCRLLADVLGSGDSPVRLHTMHIPHEYGRFPDALEPVLLAQRDTLRTLGVQAVWKSADCSWPLTWGVLHADCAVFGFSNNGYNAPFDWVAIHAVHGVPGIARSVEVESLIRSPSRMSWSFMFFVIAVDLRTGPDAPSHEAMRQLAECFPHLAFLDMRVGNLSDLLEVAALVAPFNELREVTLDEDDTARELDDAMRSRVAEAIVSAGCEMLSQVTFPDKSSRIWSDEDEAWFDPETVGSEEEEEDDEDDESEE